MAAPALHLTRRGPLREVVLEAIRDAIYCGHFAPGEAIREMHMARQLQVSQAPVREALLQLERQGLVARTPNLGTTVVELSNADLRERVSMRVLLETIASLEASRRMSCADFSELDLLNAAMHQHIHANQYYQAGQSDLAFHRFIWRKSGNATLARMLDDLTTPLFAYMSILRSRGTEQLESEFFSHQPWVDAMRRRDETAIRTQAKRIIESGYVRFQEVAL